MILLQHCRIKCVCLERLIHYSKKFLTKGYDTKNYVLTVFCIIPLSLKTVFCDASTTNFYISFIEQSSILQNWCFFVFLSAVKVGHSGQTQEQLIENVIAVVSEIAKKVPRGWSNIQSIHLKTSESVALPLYNSLPDVENVIESTEPPLKKRKKF